MNIVSFTEARNGLKAVLDRVVNDADATVITRRDAEDAVVMSLDHYNSLMETVYLLRSPANAEHLSRSIAQYKAGKVTRRELTQDKKTLKRINRLIKDVKRSPFEGIGKPEALRENLSGFWSRRIDDTNRWIYS
ncbi:unnamed protein product, partial [Cyprideis torosa]